MLMEDLETLGYSSSAAAHSYGRAEDLDGAEWALIGLGAAAVAVGVGAVIYGRTHPEAGQAPSGDGNATEDDGMDWFLNPANPLSPLSPVSPIWND